MPPTRSPCPGSIWLVRRFKTRPDSDEFTRGRTNGGRGGGGQKTQQDVRAERVYRRSQRSTVLTHEAKWCASSTTSAEIVLKSLSLSQRESRREDLDEDQGARDQPAPWNEERPSMGCWKGVLEDTRSIFCVHFILILILAAVRLPARVVISCMRAPLFQSCHRILPALSSRAGGGGNHDKSERR